MIRNFIFLAVSVSMILTSCRTKSDLTEEELYQILNEIISDNSLKIKRACWEFTNIPLTGEYLNGYTTEDLEFNKRQREIFKNHKIKSERLKWFKPRIRKEIFVEVDSICNNGILHHISFPIISIDRQKVVIEIKENCNCMLGGQGGKYLYEKRNGRWVRVKVYDFWISDNINGVKTGSQYIIRT